MLKFINCLKVDNQTLTTGCYVNHRKKKQNVTYKFKKARSFTTKKTKHPN